MALSAAAVCSYMGAYWFLWQSIVSILVIPVYEKAMYDAIIVVILMILRGILNIASATCSHYLGFRLETNLRKNGLHKLLDASSSFFDHNSSGEIRKIIDDNAAETHKTVAHLIPDNVTAVMTPVLMFVLMFAIDYRLGILLILTTVIGVLQYRKMSGGTEFLSGYSAALQKMSAATVEYVRGMQIIKIFGVTVQYYKTLINSIKEYKQYVYQYSLSCKNPYVGFQVLFNVFYAFSVPAAVVFISYGEPAMLDTQTWERVQELRKQRKRPNRYDEVGLFSGILFCADCGSVMYQQRYQTDKRKQDCYICGNYKKRTHDCTAHFIRTDLLTAGVLSNLRKVTSYAAKHEARFMKLLIEQNEDGGKRRNAAKKKELEAAEKRIAELSAIFKRLYEDSVTGRISDERFTELSADYEAEQRELKERAAAIQAELSKAQEATVNAEKFMNVVRRHTSFEELTPTLLREFVEKIVVHECSYDENKTRRQDIEIYYSFVGKVDLPE